MNQMNEIGDIADYYLHQTVVVKTGYSGYYMLKLSKNPLDFCYSVTVD